jgi:hypothetical protein
MRFPVRPVAPRRRICIFGMARSCRVLRTGCFVKRKEARYVSEDRSSRNDRDFIIWKTRAFNLSG